MEEYEKQEQSREIEVQRLAGMMGITVDEYREINCEATTDLDGSLKVSWPDSADSGIVAKIKGKQSADDDHVTISQDMSQLGDGY